MSDPWSYNTPPKPKAAPGVNVTYNPTPLYSSMPGNQPWQTTNPWPAPTAMNPPLEDERVDELAEMLEVDPTLSDGSFALTGKKGTYPLSALFIAMVEKLEKQMDSLKRCPECGEVGEVEPGDYLCKDCRNAA